MEDILRINPTRRYSDATVHNRTAYFVEVPASGHADIRTQAREMFAAADATLQKVGSNRSRLLSAMVYLSSMDDLAAFNDEWERWLPPDCAPSRACVRANLAVSGLRVEVAFIAAVLPAGMERRNVDRRHNPV